MTTVVDLFTQITNAVLDLQGSHLQSFERPLKTLARLLHHPDLEVINRSLTERVDFDAFMAASEKTQGGMAGSARLAWPNDPEQVLGLTLLLIDRLAANPDEATNIGFRYFYSGSKIIAGVHSLTGQVIIPFVRDYKTYVMTYGDVKMAVVKIKSKKVFIVHGHDGEPREAVSGFLRKIDFTPVILHEQTNLGRTIVEKFEAHSDVDFAVVLLTPDDVGGPKGGPQQARARQNVILELGYFIGKLGRQNVCAIKLGDIELPSDIIGVVWTPFDTHGAWKTSLAKELRGAGHAIDWDKAMGP